MKTLLMVVVVFTLILVVQGLQMTSHAAPVSQATSCVVDVALVLDGSGSINSQEFDIVQEFTTGVIENLPLGPTDARVGVIQFANFAREEIPFGNDRNTLVNGIRSIQQLGGGTNIRAALEAGAAAFPDPNRSRVIVLMTDGVPDPEDPGLPDVAAGIKDRGTAIFTVGVGDGIDPALLRTLSSDPDDRFAFISSDFNALNNLVSNIIEVCDIVPNEITDIVFDDANQNGIQDPGEEPLVDIPVELLNADTQELVAMTQTDNTGRFVFNVPAGNYVINVVLPEDLDATVETVQMVEIEAGTVGEKIDLSGTRVTSQGGQGDVIICQNVEGMCVVIIASDENLAPLISQLVELGIQNVVVTPPPQEATPPQEMAASIRQWASGAEATSFNLSTESPQRIIGEPDTTDCRGRNGDGAWFSDSRTGQDAVTVTFDQIVIPEEVNIYQTWAPGSITSVSLILADSGDEVVIPNSDDPSQVCPHVFNLNIKDRIPNPSAIMGIRIELDQSIVGDWNGIDAVELVGIPR